MEVTAACIFRDTNKVSGQAIVGIAATGWQTITCTKTRTSVSVAVVGGATRTTTKTVGAISNTSPVSIGGKGDGTDPFNGLMDRVSITIG